MVGALAASSDHVRVSTLGKTPWLTIFSLNPRGAPIRSQLAKMQDSLSPVAQPHAPSSSAERGVLAFRRSEYVHYEFSEFVDQWFGNLFNRPPIEKSLDSVYKVEVVGGRVQKLRDDATHLFVRRHLLDGKMGVPHTTYAFIVFNVSGAGLTHLQLWAYGESRGLLLPAARIGSLTVCTHMACASLRFKAGGYSANCLEAFSLRRLVSRQRPTSDS